MSPANASQTAFVAARSARPIPSGAPHTSTRFLRGEGASRQFLKLFLSALTVRCLYILVTPWLKGLPWEALRAAISLAERGELGNVYADQSGPSAHVSPLYPLVVSLIIRAAGGWNLTSVLIVRVLAAVATSAAIALLPQISTALGWGRRIGAYAAVAMILLPLHWRHDTISFWEAPFSFLVFTLVVLTILRLRHTTDGPRLSGLKLGALLGIAGLLSPPVCIAGILAFFGSVMTSARWRVQLSQTMPIAFGVLALSLAPWIYRNAVVLGGFVPFRSNLGLELHVGNTDGADGRFYSTIKGHHPAINATMLQEYKDLGEIPFMRRRQAEALSWIKNHPSEFLSLCVRRARGIWFASPKDWRGNAGSAPFKFVVNSAISILAFCGLIRLFLGQSPARFTVLGAIVGFAGIYLVTHADIRYLYPLFWLNVLLAAETLQGVFGRTDSSQTDRPYAEP